MTPETRKELWELLDKVIEVLCLVSGTKSYDGAIAVLRTGFHDKNTSPAPFLHALARKIYPTKEPDSVNPEHFYEILGLIDTKEKMDSVLASLPEEGAPEIREFLEFLLKVYFPSQRAAAQELAKQLPHLPGGAPTKMPGPEVCWQICDEINAKHRQGVQLGIAQRQAAEKWNLKPRMIQRIWAARRLR